MVKKLREKIKNFTARFLTTPFSVLILWIAVLGVNIGVLKRKDSIEVSIIAELTAFKEISFIANTIRKNKPMKKVK